jgi:hypothetical protein
MNDKHNPIDRIKSLLYPFYENNKNNSSLIDGKNFLNYFKHMIIDDTDFLLAQKSRGRVRQSRWDRSIMTQLDPKFGLRPDKNLLFGTTEGLFFTETGMFGILNRGMVMHKEKLNQFKFRYVDFYNFNSIQDIEISRIRFNLFSSKSYVIYHLDKQLMISKEKIDIELYDNLKSFCRTIYKDIQRYDKEIIKCQNPNSSQ